ncbi:MerR family transcriptional regulator [Haloimpatiens massiliensis]|uniref:MerR family transcriptional regulator n=1 Tax=Haloimpatiens massiliensis TaxID=1658110 RepID=UPI001FA855A2|nr:MerR family transcriptional regulator [Haloimpatiens massiliensis]
MKNYYSINEVANIFDITTNKIRYYEKKGLLVPLRDVDNEYRKFTYKDIMKLQAILLYRSIGLSIKDIKDIMFNNNSSNYLNHFNREWQIVSNEIDRLNVVRNSL